MPHDCLGRELSVGLSVAVMPSWTRGVVVGLDENSCSVMVRMGDDEDNVVYLPAGRVLVTSVDEEGQESFA